MTRDTLPGEEWRAVPGFPNYEVSSLGRVWSHLTSRTLKGTIDRGGYPRFFLYADGATQRYCAHQLVAIAFIGPYPPDMEVLHNDGDPLNNALSNLRYGTRVENEADKIAHGRHPNLVKTHCPHGHPYDEENTGPNRNRDRTLNPTRRCRTCNRNRARALYQAKRLAADDRAGTAETGPYLVVRRAC